ncbi:unnamed protein product, partial [Didymodactylos carnosus]
ILTPNSRRELRLTPRGMLFKL